MDVFDIKKIKVLEDENRGLKQIFADLSLENRALRDVIEKKLKTSDKMLVCQIYERDFFDDLTLGTLDIIAEQDGLFLPARYPTL